MGLPRINGTGCTVIFCSCLVNFQERWDRYVTFPSQEEDGIMLKLLVAAKSVAVLLQTHLP